MRNPARALLAGALCAISVLGACGKGAPAGDAASPASASPTSAGSASGAAADVATKIAELAKAAQTCPWQSGFALSCGAYMKWIQAREGSGVAHGPAGDLALASMIEAPDEKTRYLGAAAFAHGFDRAGRRDAALAKRILAAARKETQPPLAVPFGDLIAQLNYAATGTLEEVKGIVRAHELVNLRTRIVGSMMMENSDDDAVFDWPRELIKSDEAKIRLAAIDAYVHNQGAVRRLGDICAFMLENMENPDQLVAATAGGNLTRIGNKGCAGSYDKLLDSLDKRVKAKSIGDYDAFAEGLGWVCEDKTATPAHKTHAIAILKAMAGLDPAKMHQVRFFSLTAMLVCDPEGGKKWLQGFSNDKDERVKKHAADLLTR